MSNKLSKDEVIDIIVKETDYTRDEIEEKIRETVEMMDNMVNEEGAAYVVANHLNVVIHFDKSSDLLRINQLIPGQSNITIIGRLSKIFQARNFNRKDGSTGKVQNLELIDATGNIRVVLWDNATNLIKEKNLSVGKVIRLIGGNTKLGLNNTTELSIGSQGTISEVVNYDKNDYPEVKHSDLISIGDISTSNQEVSIRGKIMDIQPIYEFSRENSTGRVMSTNVKDVTQEIRVVFWNEQCEIGLKLKINDVIEITDVRVSENKNGYLE
ncbi:MAG: OB-fold nucleic acid binding domain-containing protein, partial [Candidatus Heimdallarchaeota archaeon]|nr:OB-fold nucleic acid binding domain-containing protein [Candidatus Heimdallarchaeota archaeon]